MKKEKIYGYDYDEKQQKYVLNEKEAKVIKAVSDLFTTYNLEFIEIDNLFSGENTIIDVIAERIISIYNDIQFYDKDYKTPFNDDELENNLLDENNIQDKIINTLLKAKTDISKFDVIIKERIYKKIDDTIILIGNKNDILNKYENFEDFKYLKRNDLKNLYTAKLNISYDKTDEKDFDIQI